MTSLQKHTNKKNNKKEKYAQTTLTRLAGAKCIAKGAMYMNLKNRVTNKINNKALATYKSTIQHKHATLSILMWLLAVCLGLTMLIMLPSNTNSNKLNTATAVETVVDTGGSEAITIGDGSAENPYQISTPMQLRTLSDHGMDWSSSYILMNDITITTDFWMPIGGIPAEVIDDPVNTDVYEFIEEYAFSGTFDGNGFQITFEKEIINTGIVALNGIRSIPYHVGGLFGWLNGGTIKNLGVNWQGGLQINEVLFDTGDDSIAIGGIVANSCGGNIINCYCTGNLSGENTNEGVGGIVGIHEGDNSLTIENCYTSCDINVDVADRVHVGGILGGGEAGEVSINSCYSISEINVVGYAIVGGIAGFHDRGLISNCYNAGALNCATDASSMDVGGIAGYVLEGDISNCYNIGSISAESALNRVFVGGIVAIISGGTSNCFNAVGSADAMFSNGDTIGGIVDKTYRDNTSNCYYDYPADGGTRNDTDLASKVSGESAITYLSNTLNWGTIVSKKDAITDSTVWTVVDGINNGFPILTAFYEYYDITAGKPATLTGSGTQSDPYKINNAQDLKYFANTQSMWGTSGSLVYVELMDDIEYKDSWSPIGTGSGSNAFYGVFDGNGHRITFANQITLSAEDEYDDILGGVFGYVAEGSIIQNLGVNWQVGLVVQAEYGLTTVGGIAGEVYGEISNCYNMGTVRVASQTNNTAGGIAGSGGLIKNCYNEGNIYVIEGNIYTINADDSTSNVGGIVGIQSDLVSNCYNEGSVSASAFWVYAGGIAGSDGTSDISNCYNEGSVNCYAADTAEVGGITGYSPQGNIFNCYNTGSIDCSTGPYILQILIGGIVGYYDGGTVINCFNILENEKSITADRTGQEMTSIGGIVGIDGNSVVNVSNCFYNIAPTNANNTFGTLVAGSNGESLLSAMKDKSSFTSANGNFSVEGTIYSWNTGADYAWDFDNTWGINADINDGLPVLRVFYPVDYSVTYQYDSTGENADQPNVVKNFQTLFDGSAPYTLTLEGDDLFAQEGYSYSQWTNGSNLTYAVSQEISVTESITLYPVWEILPVEFTIQFNSSDTASSVGNIFVYILADDVILQQGILNNGATFSATAEPTAQVSVIVTGGYMTNITLTGDDGQQEGNRFVLDMSSITNNDTITITYMVTAPNVNTGFNNSIVI